MPDAVVADDAAKARFRIEGRQLYNPPRNPDAVIFPEIQKQKDYPQGVPFCEMPAEGDAWLWPLTAQQYLDVQVMFDEADERRARALNVEEVERSIALCEKTRVGVPKWMRMALDMLKAERHAKYGHLDRLQSV